VKKISIILFLLLLAGCAGVSVKKYYKDHIYPPTKPAEVKVFNQAPADKNFKELGEITVAAAESWLQVEKAFREKASEMGANAVYVLSSKKETKEYSPNDNCYAYEEYYYPYQHFGWRMRDPNRFYPRGSYYCYGYSGQPKRVNFITAVGIAIRIE